MNAYGVIEVMRHFLLSSVAFMFFIFSGSVIAGEADCGPLTNHFGPYDYNTATANERRLVDRPHFPPKVEQLRRGNTGSLGQDISYTLSVFPNHARALLAMSNLALREKLARPKDSAYTVDCWFDRAFRFRPQNAAPRMIYGVYLLKLGKSQEALGHLEKASQLSGENANLSYNLGLAYFELRDYEKSLFHAHQAYRLGFELPGLRGKLEKAGKWREPAKASVVTTEDVKDQVSKTNKPETEIEPAGGKDRMPSDGALSR